MNTVLYYLYATLSYLAWPFAQLYLRYRIGQGKEIEARLNERFGVSAQERPKGKLVWFHVASLGEGVSALPLIAKISRKRNHHVLVTYGTVTASEILPKRLPKKVQHCFVPFDLSFWVKNFLNSWRPDIGVFIESELWPALLLESQAQKLPLVLLNGRMSERSYTRWAKVKPLVRRLLSAFSVGLMQDEAMAERYQALGLENVQVLGNIKMAADPLPVDEALLERITTQKDGRPCWIAASMHVYEEDFILEAHQKLRTLFPDLLTILVPRKLEHVEALYAKLRRKAISFASHKKGDAVTDKAVYVVDVMGEMGTFLKLSEIAYVGGSQPKEKGKALGGHNPLEPALLENAICFGPDMSNTQKVADELIETGAAETVKTSQELVDFVGELLNGPKLRHKRAQKALTYAQSQKTIVDKAIKCIAEHVNVEQDFITPARHDLVSLTRPGFWSTDSLASKALWAPSQIYQSVSQFYQGTKHPRKFDVPVICVGNIIAGGAGKTPTIMAIATYLIEKGCNPHIVSRGYGRKRKDTLRVDASRTVADVGDEPLLLAKVAPTWVGDRYEASKRAIHLGATHILLDDGFQDASIEKDFSLLVFDGHYGIGNGKTLPAGPLRESFETGIMRADKVMIVGEDRTGLESQLDMPLTAKFIPLTKLPQKKFVAFAGIGNPTKFFDTLEKSGAELVWKEPLPDHARYTAELLNRLENKARELEAELVTTEKDAVKLKMLSVPLHVFKVELEISDLSCLDDLVQEQAYAHA